jgi:phosphate transport system substrate-binding protein
MKRLAEVYEKKHPGVTIKVLPGLGSSGGVRALAGGAVDIAVTGRPLSEEEQRLGLSVREIARSPFVFVVSAENPRTDITTKELEEIFLGTLTRWEDGSLVRVILRPESDSDSSIVRGISTGIAAAYARAHAREGMIIAFTDQESANYLQSKGGGIGFSTLTQITTEALHLKVLSFNGSEPSLRSLAAGDYTLYKPTFLVTTSSPSRAVENFIRFLLSGEGRTIVRMSGNLFIDSSARNN